MRHILPTILCSILLLGIACGRGKDNINTEVADLLFNKSKTMITSYIDSMQVAPDSAAYQSLVRNFDEKMTALNYEFPPDTDLALSEEQNDILIKLYKKFEKVKLRRDSIITQKIKEDSVAGRLPGVDSTKNLPDSVKGALASRNPGN